MNKHIDEMAQTTVGCKRKSCGDCSHLPNCTTHYVAENLYNAGYRKSTDVAREIIDLLREIQNDLQASDEFREASAIRYAIGQIEYYAEKKYESEGADDET